MSIRNKLKINKFKKQVKQHINAPTILTIVEGVVDDVVNRKYPSNTQLGMFYTLGDLNDIGGFYKVDWIVNDIIGTAIGRSIRMIGLSCLTEQDLTTTAVLQTVQQTDELQQQLVRPTIRRLVEVYGDQQINSTKEQELFNRFEQLANIFN